MSIRKNFFTQMSAREYREVMGLNTPRQTPKQENKFHAKKTELDGVLFDSKHEAGTYKKLKSLADAGIIQNLQLQQKFELQPGFKTKQGQTIRPICYVSDFTYEKEGQMYVVDSKSPATRTPVYLVKKKLFQYKYPDYIFLEM